MKTLIHKNLHNGLMAITQKGVVVGYCDSATLIACDVKEDAEKAAFSRNGGKRTVHLWVRGILVDVVGFVPLKGREAVVEWQNIDHPRHQVRYNPKRCEPGFMMGDHVWSGGDSATISIHGMWVA